MSVMKEFIEEIKALAVRQARASKIPISPSSKNEIVLGYLESFFDNHMDDSTCDKILARIDDLRESAGRFE